MAGKHCCVDSFQVVKELEEDWVKLLVLLLDLFVSMILSIVTVSESNHLARNESSDPNECGPNGTNLTSNQAKASLGLFVTGGLLYILIIAVYYIYKICKLDCRRSTVQNVFIRRHTWVVIGGFCFYVGDNLPIPICNSGSRVEAIQVFGIIMLSIATVTYLPVLINFTPTHNKGVQTEEQIEEEQKTDKRLLQEVRSNQSERGEKKKILADCRSISLLVKMWKKISACVVILAKMMKKIPPVAILLLAKMTSLDVVYTAIERAVSTHCDINDRCAQKNSDNNVTNYVAWVYWAVYIIVFFILCLYELWTYENEEAEKSIPAQGENTALENMNGERTTGNNLKQYMKCIIIAFLVSMFAGLYILADTRLPLACTVAAKNKENWIRFGLWVFNVFSAVVVIILWICWQRIHDKR